MGFLGLLSQSSADGAAYTTELDCPRRAVHHHGVGRAGFILRPLSLACVSVLSLRPLCLHMSAFKCLPLRRRPVILDWELLVILVIDYNLNPQ